MKNKKTFKRFEEVPRFLNAVYILSTVRFPGDLNMRAFSISGTYIIIIIISIIIISIIHSQTSSITGYRLLCQAQVSKTCLANYKRFHDYCWTVQCTVFNTGRNFIPRKNDSE